MLSAPFFFALFPPLLTLMPFAPFSAPTPIVVVSLCRRDRRDTDDGNRREGHRHATDRAPSCRSLSLTFHSVPPFGKKARNGLGGGGPGPLRASTLSTRSALTARAVGGDRLSGSRCPRRGSVCLRRRQAHAHTYRQAPDSCRQAPHRCMCTSALACRRWQAAGHRSSPATRRSPYQPGLVPPPRPTRRHQRRLRSACGGSHRCECSRSYASCASPIAVEATPLYGRGARRGEPSGSRQRSVVRFPIRGNSARFSTSKRTFPYAFVAGDLCNPTRKEKAPPVRAGLSLVSFMNVASMHPAPRVYPAAFPAATSRRYSRCRPR